MATNPISRRRAEPELVGGWRTLLAGSAESYEQLESYAAEMTRRDPMRRQWAVKKRTDHDGRERAYVDCLA